MSRRVRITDIAKYTGVSSSTVSIVLNEHPLSRYVADKTKKTILKAAEQFHYRPNKLALAMHTQKTGMIGFMCGRINSPHYAEVLNELVFAAENRGFRLQAFLTSWDVKREVAFLDLLRDRSVDGLIIHTNCLCVDVDAREAAIRDQLPVVCIGNAPEGIAGILFEYDPAMRGMFEHLIQTGHRKIAMVYSALYPERYESFRRIAKEFQIPPLAYPLKTSIPTTSTSETASIISQILTDKPDALLINSDSIAMMFEHLLIEAGIRLPEDLSLLTIGGCEWLSKSILPLAALKINKKMLAEMAIRMLIQVQESNSCSKENITLEYVPNNSVQKR